MKIVVIESIGRNSIKKDQYLTHLIMNPDPQPCPPLHAPEDSLLREGLTFKVGGLAGFDMSVWESGSGEEGRKKVRPHSPLRSRSKTRTYRFCVSHSSRLFRSRLRRIHRKQKKKRKIEGDNTGQGGGGGSGSGKKQKQ